MWGKNGAERLHGSSSCLSRQAPWEQRSKAILLGTLHSLLFDPLFLPFPSP